MQSPESTLRSGTDAASSTTTAHALSAKPHKKHWRAMLLALFLLVSAAVVYFTPLGTMIKDREQVRQMLSHMGIWLYPIFVLGTAAIVVTGIPRLAICFAGGLLLGFIPGLLLVQLGTLVGDYALFLFVRWGGRSYVQHHWPKLQRMADAIHSQGIMGVILVRQFPVPGMLSNLVLGLSRLRHRDFLVGTTIGIFPEAIPVTLIGAGMMKASAGTCTAYITTGVAAFALVWIGYKYAMKRLKSTKECSDILAEVETKEGDEN